MKFSFSTLGCPSWSLGQIVENAANYGYDALELRLLDGEVLDPVKDATKIKQAIARIRERGLDVCALDTSCRFNISKREERERQIADARNWIALAQETQVGLLRVFGGNLKEEPQPTIEQQDGWMIESLREVAQTAEQAKIIVALETHDAFNSPGRVANILRTVNSPYIKALWDSHHPYRTGASAEAVIRTLGDYLGPVVHIKDARKKDPNADTWQLVLMGEGEVPVREMLLGLKQHNYNGYVSVEWEKKWHPEIEEPEVALPQHIRWLKQLLGS
ncbi:MAG: sugar phosphate isomerase/epimerase [Ktedonobacteraceae bacterium]|nr:sugar phosphate isomerase/epimerase [Ktedonobacteraceae bacterium]MBO0797074.1 sugar phosphate isomerase/epimerase [Ktedonobacteraceae bacterium]